MTVAPAQSEPRPPRAPGLSARGSGSVCRAPREVPIAFAVMAVRGLRHGGLRHLGGLVAFEDERAFLRPRARLMSMLGEELISNERVALIELVKNAYDADAQLVVIRFIAPLEEGRGSLEVWDDGHGMSEATVRGAWMEIATPYRQRSPRSETKGRRVLGAKGIGRFAAARLARQTTLVTRRDGAEEITLKVDWGDFTQGDAYLDQVPISWSASEPRVFAPGGDAERLFDRITRDYRDSSGQPGDPGSQPADPGGTAASPGASLGHSAHGSLVRLEKLRQDWDDNAVQSLKRSLSRLIPPPPPAELDVPDQPEFTIFLDAPDELRNRSGFVAASEALAHPDYRLVGTVESDGRAHLTFRSDAYHAEEEIESRLRAGQRTSCGPLQIDIRVWDLENTSVKRLLTLDLGARNISEIRALIRANSGIALYRDGFRVQPFGEPEFDWLGLDQRRVNNPTMRLSNNQIAGFVYTTADDNPGLRDRSHREGLIDTPEYEDLKAVIVAAINEIETRRYKLRRGDGGIARERERSKGIFEAFSLRPLREVINSRYSDDIELGRALESAEDEVQHGVRQVQEVLSRFSRLATLGTLVDVILHEGRTALTRINYVLRRMTKLIEKTMPGDPETAAAMEAIGKRFDEQAQALDRLFTQIEPLSGRRRGRPRRLSLQEVVRQGLAVIEGETEDAGVHVEVAGDDQVVTVDPADIMQIVINLVRNAVYWTSELPEPEPRRVMVRTQREDDGTVDLVVSDNGPGVPQDVRDLIFDAYFTTKADGVGLGLSIAGSIAKDFYAGELELLADGPLPGATFRARLRRRTG